MDIAGGVAQSTLVFGSETTNDEERGLRQVRGSPLVVQLRRDSSAVDTLAALAARLDLRERAGRQAADGGGRRPPLEPRSGPRWRIPLPT